MQPVADGGGTGGALRTSSTARPVRAARRAPWPSTTRSAAIEPPRADRARRARPDRAACARAAAPPPARAWPPRCRCSRRDGAARPASARRRGDPALRRRRPPTGATRCPVARRGAPGAHPDLHGGARHRRRHDPGRAAGRHDRHPRGAARPRGHAADRRRSAAARTFSADAARAGHGLRASWARGSRTREEKREVTAAFAGGAALLLLAGGGMSLRWFGRLAVRRSVAIHDARDQGVRRAGHRCAGRRLRGSACSGRGVHGLTQVDGQLAGAADAPSRARDVRHGAPRAPDDCPRARGA